MAAPYTPTTVEAGYGAETTINANFTAIATAFGTVLNKDSATDNAMEVDLDLAGNDILNAGSITLKLTSYTVATLPSAASNARTLVYVSDGSAGSACIAISDGSNWKVVSTISSLTNVSAS